MPGLVPGTHVFAFFDWANKTWMAGTSPAMTCVERNLRKTRGRRWMIANHPSNRTTVPESPDGPDLLEE
jgi:hypothetical protein